MKRKIIFALFFASALFGVVCTSQAESPWLCGQPENGSYLKLFKTTKPAQPWHVEFYRYDSLKKTHKKETKLRCHAPKSNVTASPAEHILTLCQILYGPDASDNILIRLNHDTGKISASLFPKGPTGTGKTTDLTCQAGIN